MQPTVLRYCTTLLAFPVTVCRTSTCNYHHMLISLNLAQLARVEKWSWTCIWHQMNTRICSSLSL